MRQKLLCLLQVKPDFWIIKIDVGANLYSRPPEPTFFRFHYIVVYNLFVLCCCFICGWLCLQITLFIASSLCYGCCRQFFDFFELSFCVASIVAAIVAGVIYLCHCVKWSASKMSSERKSLPRKLPYFVHRVQCDQICRNVANFSKIYTSLAIFLRFISYLLKCWTHFGTIFMRLDNFSLL